MTITDKTFCGKTWDDMDSLLDSLCGLADGVDMTNDEADAVDIGIQCMVEVMNRMVDGRPILWDQENDDPPEVSDLMRVTDGLYWILADDRFGFGSSWEDGEPQDDDERAGKYIWDAVALLRRVQWNMLKRE